MDGVAIFDAVSDAIVELTRPEEVLKDFNSKVADEDAMLLGRVTYQEWASTGRRHHRAVASHINGVPWYVISRSLDAAPWGAFDDAT